MIPTVELPKRKRNGRVGVFVRTPFAEDFVEALKEDIPHTDREWLPDRSVWWIAIDYRKHVETLILDYWIELQRIGGKDDGAIVTRGGTVAVQERLEL